ncbi:MAG: hypothetical protein ACK4PR_07350, partial [Gammaproteobacteria bacterium]
HLENRLGYKLKKAEKEQNTHSIEEYTKAQASVQRLLADAHSSTPQETNTSAVQQLISLLAKEIAEIYQRIYSAYQYLKIDVSTYELRLIKLLGDEGLNQPITAKLDDLFNEFARARQSKNPNQTLSEAVEINLSKLQARIWNLQHDYQNNKLDQVIISLVDIYTYAQFQVTGYQRQLEQMLLQKKNEADKYYANVSKNTKPKFTFSDFSVEKSIGSPFAPDLTSVSPTPR